MPRLQHARPGQRVSADYLNRLVDSGVERATGVGTLIRRIAGGLSVSIERQNFARVIHASIQSIQNDYLTCKLVVAPDQDSTETIYVAKPPLLRMTPIDGKTILYGNGQTISYVYTSQRYRVATDVDTSTTENQVMTPDYYVGEIVLAISGYTGVAAGSDYCYWCDLNVAGRFWAKEAP